MSDTTTRNAAAHAAFYERLVHRGMLDELTMLAIVYTPAAASRQALDNLPRPKPAKHRGGATVSDVRLA